MTNIDLAASYMIKAEKRLRAPDVLFEEEAWSDVVREAQEIVELAEKAMLRRAGIDPPKWHDVGGLTLEHRDRFPDSVQDRLEAVAATSKRLRRERELSFYGDIDFVPTEQYSRDDAQTALDETRVVVQVAQEVFRDREEDAGEC